MKNNILNLEEDIKVYVLDELDYKNKKYVFTIQLDENGEPIEENVHVLEVTVLNEKLIAKQIEDFEISSIVSNMFLARLKQENNER